MRNDGWIVKMRKKREGNKKRKKDGKSEKCAITV